MAQAFRAEVGLKTEDEWDRLVRALTDKGLRDGDRVLDVGCGVCRASVAIAARTKGVHIDAIARTPIEATHARSQIRREQLDRRIVVRVLADALPFEDEAFDVAVSIDASKNILEEPRLLADVYRVLRQNGALHVRWYRADPPAIGTDTSFGDGAVFAVERAGFVVTSIAQTCVYTSLVRRPPRRRFEPSTVATWELVALKPQAPR